MKKIAMVLIALVLIAAFLFGYGIFADRQILSEELIRLHVVGASDSKEDQQVKLQVRDAVIACVEENMAAAENANDAEAVLQNMLPQLETVANETLESMRFSQRATVSLQKEAFPARDYDTFSLPAGVYRSLRVTIGQGQGKNWWCVVFPSLCIPAASEEFEDTAAGAGFSDTLTDTLQKEPQYEVRFFFLDCLGWLQNFFYGL